MARPQKELPSSLASPFNEGLTLEASISLNERVLDFIRTAQESVFARHPAALKLLPATERVRLAGKAEVRDMI